MLDAIALSLAADLAASGFAPDPLSVKLVGARIADRGAFEFECLPSTITPPKPLRSLCAHHLGMGASLTEFLIGGVSPDRDFIAAAASLGGIAHTIFAVFDALLDVSHCVPQLFGGDSVLASDPEIRSRQQLVIELVNLYFLRLSLFPPDSLRVRALLDRAIRRLYDAELHSAMPAEVCWKTWWRKNALPIIVMGLPAWLSIRPEGKIGFPQHLQWLGRVGEFLGWLDDFADYEQDCALGNANRLRLQDAISMEACARRVAAKGRRVLSFWDSHNSVSPARDTFRVIVWTWLAAPESNLSRNFSAASRSAGLAQ
jgi:hypothetical protein